MKKGTSLPRGEWDFSGCPPEQLWRCWSYEYGREVDWVRHAYATRTAGTFDACGNWHCWRDIGDPETAVEFLNLSIIPGFPDVPFLQSLKTARFAEPTAVSRSSSIRHLTALLRRTGFEQAYAFAIKWHESDKTILRDFAAVLKKIRPYDPFKRRGRSERRRHEADLKALGAYRLLLSGMTAAKARAYTSGFRRLLYNQESEWFIAKRRAAKIIAGIRTLEPRR